MNMIEAIGLRKNFRDEIILDGLNFSAQQGDVISIIGPSGEGKTTFLRCLAGLEAVDDGSIRINGRFLVKKGKYVSERERLDILKDVGFVFQSFNLFNNLTVIQNIEIALRSKGLLSNDEIRIISKGLAEQFKLVGKESLYPNQLSGGQKQRVAIARALSLNPKIILFDEPTSALDSESVKNIAEIIRKLSDDNYTVIVVTHDLGFATKVSDIILGLKNKKFSRS